MTRCRKKFFVCSDNLKRMLKEYKDAENATLHEIELNEMLIGVLE